MTVPVHSRVRGKPTSGTCSGDRRRGRIRRQGGPGSCAANEQKASAAKFKKYAVPAGVNEPKKSCHGVRKARAEVAAYADCTESQMMAMFGWTDPKMPAHYIAQAHREKLGFSGMDKVVAFDTSTSPDDFVANEAGTNTLNRVVTFPGNIRKKAL